MNTNSKEYWPFPVSDEDNQWPEMLEKIDFLEGVHAAGFKCYRFGINNYGAEFKQRAGIIIERGRRDWELRLSETESQKLSAYVSSFPVAGKALRLWLEGRGVSDVLAEVDNSLVKPAGAAASFVITEDAN